MRVYARSIFSQKEICKQLRLDFSRVLTVSRIRPKLALIILNNYTSFDKLSSLEVETFQE